MTPAEPPDLRVIIVAINANTASGGEALLPVQYFRLLRARGLDVHLVCHERNGEDLHQHLAGDIDRIHLTPERTAIRFLERAGTRLPRTVKSLTTWLLMGVITAIDLRRVARTLVCEAPGPAIVHEPVPVSPRRPSFMREMGAPVVVGPLNGGMTYPAGFTGDVRPSERVLRWLSRAGSNLANRFIDGKRRAHVILVANARTKRALPPAARNGRIYEMAENGVDLSTFTRRPEEPPARPPRFAFVGRLVDWKRVDLLIDAMSRLPDDYLLEIVGDGPLNGALQDRTANHDLEGRVTFHGRLSHADTAEVLMGCNALVLPSVYECGGAVVLEAMAVGLPVIATEWGGPADYVVPEVTGILVAPTSPDELSAGLASAMTRVADDPALAGRMGESGRARVEAQFDWQRKIDRMVGVYRAAAVEASA